MSIQWGTFTYSVLSIGLIVLLFAIMTMTVILLVRKLKSR